MRQKTDTSDSHAAAAASPFDFIEDDAWIANYPEPWTPYTCARLIDREKDLYKMGETHLLRSNIDDMEILRGNRVSVYSSRHVIDSRGTDTKTALHWGAKHGDENIVKLIAGTYGNYIKGVNETTNGGYTPLHLALQFDHENIFNLLVQVYGANQDIRDYSGKKPRQYSISQKAAVSQDTMRKIKARKKHAEKDLGFLRIGSLNVRVKRTTEAFSQFLGVATNNASNNNEKIHKSWGSADNLPADKMMPPPKYAPIKKRRSRRATDFVSNRQQHPASQPTTPTPTGKSTTTSRRPASVSALTTNNLLAQANPIKVVQQNDSDSDGACGFDSAWRGSA